jgi:hypothetical protein
VAVQATGTTTVDGAVSVSGAVSVTNTPTVNAQQAGSWTVSLAAGGAVQVDNSGGVPLSVRDVDSSANAPVMIHGNVTYGEVRSPVLYTVPAGKRLVVQYINLTAYVETTSPDWAPDAAMLAILTSNRSGIGQQYTLPLAPGAIFDNGRGGFEHYLTTSDALTMYFDAGTQLGLFKAAAHQDLSRLDGAIAGYLVDAR